MRGTANNLSESAGSQFANRAVDLARRFLAELSFGEVSKYILPQEFLAGPARKMSIGLVTALPSKAGRARPQKRLVDIVMENLAERRRNWRQSVRKSASTRASQIVPGWPAALALDELYGVIAALERRDNEAMHSR